MSHYKMGVLTPESLYKSLGMPEINGIYWKECC